MTGLGKTPPVLGVVKTAPSSFNASTIAPIDYRSRFVVNPIREQGSCGSCWAFSVILTI